jgi:hypothetical protein
MPTPNDYSNFQFGESKSAERQQGKLGTSGDYGQVANAPLNGNVPAEMYPNPFGYDFDNQNGNLATTRNPTLKEWRSTATGDGFADLRQFLMNSPYTAFSRVCHEQTSGEKETWRSPHDAEEGPGSGRTGIA